MSNDRQKITVAIADNYTDRMSEVVQKAQAAGMHVDQSLERLGVITGSIAPEKLQALSQVEGVLHVDPSQEIHLAPPDSDIQ